MESMPYRDEIAIQPRTWPAVEPFVSSDWRSGLPVLADGRVVLRELRHSDADALHALLSTEEVARFISLAVDPASPTTVYAATDAGVASRLAVAAGEGALLNVKINLKSLPAGADKNDIEKTLPRLEQTLVAAARSCSEAVHAVMDA